jgi:hypothetical protein
MTQYRAAAVGCLLVFAAVTLSGARSWRRQDAAKGESSLAPPSVLMYWVDRSYKQMKLAGMQKKSDRGEQYAWLLAELTNANKRHSENAKFKELSDATSQLSVSAAAAFKAAEFDRAGELAKQIDQKCNACHDQFRDTEDAGD